MPATTTSERTTAGARHLLVVDDERDICACLKDFFALRGFDVASALSGEEALRWLERESADVVLLDILLPGLSGLEVLRRIKERRPEIRVVMVTALDQRDLREAAHRCGAAGYITKPFDFSDLTWSSVLHPPVL